MASPKPEPGDGEHEEQAELRRLRSLLADTPDRVFFKDRDGHFLQINRALAERFGLAEPREAAGRTDFDFFSASHARAAQADEAAILRTGQPIAGKLEREGMPDGSFRWVLTSRFPLRDAQGAIAGTCGVSRDITEQHHAEQAVRASEERYARLLSSVSDYVYSVEVRDGQAVSTHHSPACRAVTGYGAADFRADAFLWLRIIHPADREAVLGGVRELMHKGVPVTLEHRIIRADGAVRWVSNKQVPRLDEQGRLVVYDGLISDITERREASDSLRAAHERLRAMQQQLIEAEKMQTVGQLAAGVAHEVRNPLAILEMGLQVLTDEAAIPDGTASPVLEEMRLAVARASEVIDALLQYSTEGQLDLQPTDLHELLRQALETSRAGLEKQGVRLEASLPQIGPSVRLDRARLEDALSQILLNAGAAMPEGGVLTVRAEVTTLGQNEVEASPGDRTGRLRRAGDRVAAITIADTGVGIPASLLGRVGEPFYTTRPTGEGKGLGLSVVRRIVQLHGGLFRIASREGAGTEVTLTLPLGPA